MLAMVDVFLSLRINEQGWKPRVATITKVVTLLLLAVAVVYGTYLRCGDQAKKNLWHDEVWRAQSIVHESNYLALDVPVQLSDFIFAKVGLVFFGKSEIAFRIWSMGFSIAALVLFACIVYHLFSPAVAVLGVFFLATSHGLIEHAHEFKSYSWEAFLSLLLLYLYYRAEPNRTLDAWWPVLSCLVVMAFFSNIVPMFVFLLPLIWFKIGSEFQEIFRSKSQRVAAICTGVLLLVLLVYLKSLYASNLESHGEFRFWQRAYLSNSDVLYPLLTKEVKRTLWGYVVSPTSLNFWHWGWSWVLLGVMVVVSPILMFKERSILCLFVVVPFVIQVAGSFAGKYPFFSRVSTFYYPFLLISLLYTLNYFWTRFSRSLKQSTFREMGALLLVALWMGSYAISNPRAEMRSANRGKQRVTPLFSTLEVLAKPGDIVLINPYISDPLAFYDISAKDELSFVRLPSEKRLKQESISEIVRNVVNEYPGRRVWAIGVRRIASYELLKHSLKEQKMKLELDHRKGPAYLIRFAAP